MNYLLLLHPQINGGQSLSGARFNFSQNISRDKFNWYENDTENGIQNYTYFTISKGKILSLTCGVKHTHQIFNWKLALALSYGAIYLHYVQLMSSGLFFEITYIHSESAKEMSLQGDYAAGVEHMYGRPCIWPYYMAIYIAI